MHVNVSDSVIIDTAIVSVKPKSGDFVLARALLDSGSPINCVTDELAQRLQLCRDEASISLLGIAQRKTQVKTKIYTVVVQISTGHRRSTCL